MDNYIANAMMSDLGHSEKKIVRLEETIHNLRSELALRDSELASLRSQLANKGMVE